MVLAMPESQVVQNREVGGRITCAADLENFKIVLVVLIFRERVI